MMTQKQFIGKSEEKPERMIVVGFAGNHPPVGRKTGKNDCCEFCGKSSTRRHVSQAQPGHVTYNFCKGC